MSQYGIEETKDALDLGIALVKALAAASEDGEFTIGDLMHLGPVAKSVPAAVVGLDKIIPELKDLDDAETEELMHFIDEELEEGVYEKAGEDILLGILHLLRAVKKLS